MTKGDTVNVKSSIANGSFLDIKPTSASQEIIVHNIFAPSTADVELYYSDGATDSLYMSNTGGFKNCTFHPTTTYYLRLKNVSGDTVDLGYDGVITKDTA